MLVDSRRRCDVNDPAYRVECGPWISGSIEICCSLFVILGGPPPPHLFGLREVTVKCNFGVSLLMHTS